MGEFSDHRKAETAVLQWVLWKHLFLADHRRAGSRIEEIDGEIYADLTDWKPTGKNRVGLRIKFLTLSYNEYLWIVRSPFHLTGKSSVKQKNMLLRITSACPG